MRGGANPPRERWKEPGQKTPEETRIAWETFTTYLRFIHRFADVEFITASGAARLYPDRASGRALSKAELAEIAAAVSPAVTFQRHGDYALSAAEVFALLNHYLALKTSGQPAESPTIEFSPLGPANPEVALREPVSTDWSQFTRTAADVDAYLRRHGEIPSTVWLGSIGVPPEAYLVALAEVAKNLLAGKPVPETVEIRLATLAAAANVGVDGPNLWQSWPIFPANFRAPAMMELARRQAWTLKPAILATDAK